MCWLHPLSHRHQFHRHHFHPHRELFSTVTPLLSLYIVCASNPLYLQCVMFCMALRNIYTWTMNNFCWDFRNKISLLWRFSNFNAGKRQQILCYKHNQMYMISLNINSNWLNEKWVLSMHWWVPFSWLEDHTRAGNQNLSVYLCTVLQVRTNP